ncbi:MAG: phospholipase D family protein [Candidatus Eremiobacteraeota bacterium]|nr:phospholipase D family protein [Candidatus Eremiobacteraeota bacterium]
MTLSLSSVPDVVTRIGSARDVAFGSYFLPHGAMRDALTGAAQRGAHVSVTLQADPYRNPFGGRCNTEAARVLRAAGADVALLPSDRAPFHLKAAVCDGVAYLDDRNWTKRGPEIVVADDDPQDVRLVRDALAGRGGADPALATRKDVALAREVELVEGARGLPVTVETERVATSALTRALQQHARAGAETTLVVARSSRRSRREAAAIAQLAADGVVVRVGGSNQKLALAGDTAWIGSANATGASGRTARQLDWGLLVRDRTVVGAVAAALAHDAGERPATERR